MDTVSTTAAEPGSYFEARTYAFEKIERDITEQVPSQAFGPSTHHATGDQRLSIPLLSRFLTYDARLTAQQCSHEQLKWPSPPPPSSS